MATTIYFVKATYDGNTYKLSDFYTGSSYKQIANSSMQVDMAFNDGPTILDTQIRTLPNGADLRDQTHIIVPSKKKIYRIDKIDEPNYDAYRLFLSDDPLIGNYQSFRAENMYLTRTNDPSVYTGLNDMPSLGTVPVSRTIKRVGGEGSISGDWLLVYVQPLDDDQNNNWQSARVNVNVNNNWKPFIKETFSTLQDMYDKYPVLGPYSSQASVLDNTPNYYGLYSYIEDNETYYINTSYYDPTTISWYISWMPVNEDYYKLIDFGWNEIVTFDAYGSYASRPPAGTVPLGYKYFVNESSPTVYPYVYTTIYNSNLGFNMWVRYNNQYANSFGTTASRPSTPADGYIYGNTTTMRLETYYYLDVWNDNYYLTVPTNPNNNIVNIFPNQPVIIFAFPIQTSIYSEVNPSVYKNLLSALAFRGLQWYNGTAWQSYNILSTRIINGGSLFKNSLISNNEYGTILSDIYSVTTQFPSNIESVWSVGYLKNQDIITYNVSYQPSAITSYTLREPFKYYELWIYGQKYEVPSFLVNSLYIKQSINTNGLNYMIYKDSELLESYISGTVSMEVQWSTDSLADWVAQNPTYKDQFNLRRQQQWTETIVGGLTGIGTGTASGAIGGAIIPGYKASVGAGLGALQGTASAVQGVATTAVKSYFDKKNLDLSLQSNRLLTDKLYGDTSSSLQYFNIRPGIYWVVKTMNNDSQMKFQYDSMGYPTNKVTTINAMPWTTYNYTLEAYAKLIYGYFNKIIVNAYVTQEINNKLKDGVILVE